jgi:hypothetical protein
MSEIFIDGIKVKPCVGCGFCCIKSKCAAGQRLYKSSDICNALIWSEKENRYHCDLMQLPGILGETYREELYAGEGCCAGLNSWRQNVIKRTDVKEDKINNLDPLFQAFLRSMGREMISGDALFLMISGFESELEKKMIPKNEIDEIKKLIIYHIKNSRNTKFDSFIGEFK